MKQPKTTLITGVPRSGTTLCCKILNAQDNVVALHEPIQPSRIANNDLDTAVIKVEQYVADLRKALVVGKHFEHGDRTQLSLDNPVGSTSEKGIRQVVAQRGLLKMAPRKNDFHLVVKQNAMFTALLPRLIASYPMVAIVRNPFDVLLSWLTVDLPVNRGRIPGGERFDLNLARKLNNIAERIERQWFIYQWFLIKFQSAKSAGLSVLRYEDIVRTSGESLLSTVSSNMDVSDFVLSELTPPNRSYSVEVLNELAALHKKIVNYDYQGLYSKEELLNKIEQVSTTYTYR